MAPWARGSHAAPGREDPWPDPQHDPWARGATASVEAQPDEAVQAAESTTTSIRVCRLNGEFLEVSLTKVEANELEFNRDLKRCLANNDRSGKRPVLTICWIRLLHVDTGVEIADEDRINWEWLEQGSLQYVVADVTSFYLSELPPSHALLFYYADLNQLLDPKQLITCAYWIWKMRGQAFCEHVFEAWKSALLALPHEVVNATEGPCEQMLLNRCLSLLEVLDETKDFVWEEDPGAFRRGGLFRSFWDDCPFEALLHRTFGSATMELVKQKLDAKAVEEAFNCLGDIPRERRKGQLWKLVEGVPDDSPVDCPRFYLTHGDLRLGLGAELAMALIQKNLPRWCWAGCWGRYNDTLLQHMAGALVARPPVWFPGDDSKAQLCIFLAERFTLEEFCHQAQDGANALGLVENYCDQPCAGDRELSVWLPVREAIRQQMEARVREFPGSLSELIQLDRSVRAGQWAGFGRKPDSPDSLPAFGEQMWDRAAAIRQDWLRMGWIFAERTVNRQISEVLNWHFDGTSQGTRHAW